MKRSDPKQATPSSSYGSAAEPSPRTRAALRSDSGAYLIVDKPVWNARTGELFWRGRLVLRLAGHAHAQRAILDEFQVNNWALLIRNPIAREPLGDATQGRRNAIRNLNASLGRTREISFHSAYHGVVGWCAAEWIDNDARSCKFARLNDRPC